jgi:hypothetical protein
MALAVSFLKADVRNEFATLVGIWCRRSRQREREV